MVDIGILFTSAMTLFLLIIPGYIIRKTGLVKPDAAPIINKVLVYVLNSAMLVNAFLKPFDKSEFLGCIGVVVFSFIAHALFTLVALICFRKSEKAKRNVYQFALIFSNAGFMGIPLIIDVLGKEKAIYATFYLVFFQIFVWTVGSYIYTRDKKFFSVKKIILNPGVIPIILGVIIYVSGIGEMIPAILVSAVDKLASAVVPFSMLIVGIRLAECDFKGILLNPKLFLCIALRLLVLPTLFFILIFIISKLGIYHNEVVFSAALICASAPCAAYTNSFAEMFGGDGAEASKVVSISTLFSILTMPLVAALLQLL